MKYFLFAFFLLLPFGYIHAQASTDTYCNARFGFCLGYEPALLAIQPESQNGDGCVFKDAGGKVRLTVSGSGNWNYGVDGEVISFRALYLKELANHKGTVSYKRFTNSYFIISGTYKGSIYYKKAVPRKDAFCFAYLEYQQAEQLLYNNTINLIAQTFR